MGDVQERAETTNAYRFTLRCIIAMLDGLYLCSGPASDLASIGVWVNEKTGGPSDVERGFALA